MNRLRNNFNKTGISIMMILLSFGVKGYEKEVSSRCMEEAFITERVLNLTALQAPAGKNKRVGEVWTDCNGKGGYLSIPLEEMHDNDQFIFKLI